MSCRALLISIALVVPHIATAAGPIILNGPMPLTDSLGVPGKPEGPYSPAPTPNNDILAPRDTAKPVPGEPAIAATIGPRAQKPSTGEAFGPGARYSDDLQQRNRNPSAWVVPKLELTIPFEN